jgi:tetratricopeptide (TPR) repeat protein
MTRAVAWRRSILVGLVAALLGVVGVLAWVFWPAGLPKPGSPRYEEYADAFLVGTAALDAGKTDTAGEKLSRAIELIPEEPAGWINRSLFYLRNNQPDLAARDLNKARELAPDEPALEPLLGLLAESRGQFSEAIKYLGAAVQRDPDNVAALYKLADLIGQQSEENADAEYQKLMERILAVQPNNLLALLGRAKVAARRPDLAAYRDTIGRLQKLSDVWSGEPRQKLRELEPPAQGPLPADILERLAIFQNILSKEPDWARAFLRTNPDPGKSGTSLQRFLRLAPLRPVPSAPDLSLTYTAAGGPENQPAGIRGAKWDVVLPVWPSADTATPALFVARANEVRRADAGGVALPFPSGKDGVAPSAHGVLAFDWNNDYRTDLLLAGAGGLQFWQQQPDGSFKDVTDKTKLPADVLKGDYFGAWAVDYDMDGDLDVILTPRKGSPLVLRSNRDGTFTNKPIFPGVEKLRAFAWADLDNDGAPDAALLDAAGILHVFMNERMGQFVRRETPDLPAPVVDLTAADVNDDGIFDLVLLLQNGAVLRLSDKDKGKGWDSAEIAKTEPANGEVMPGTWRVLIGDLDNNGSLDLLVSRPDRNAVWLADAKGVFQPLNLSIKGQIFGLADVNGDGRLDLLALDGGNPVRLLASGSKDYHWQAVRPRATQKETAEGNNRINSFAIGGEVEVRAGTLVVKQPITSPVVHFGLGERKHPDVIRLQWPNGALQAEFDKETDKVVEAEQRLGTSCPFLFTWDGKQMVFVADFLWSTPLGMYINAQDKGGFLQTTDWVRIRGDQLVPRDGYLDVRVQANLWETHYIDHLGLLVVDHPPGTEMYVDERFFLTPTTPQVYLTEPARPVARAWDHKGKDATEEVRALDGKYLDRAGRGLFQGVTHDHWVEADLGDDAPRTGPVYLIAHGFVHPTDSSINVAIEQGDHDRPHGLVLEVPDGKGGWKVGRDALGFPAGKNKTVLVRLDGIDGPGVACRFRLRTNMEIYWDALFWARGLDASACKVQKVQPSTAELRFRGFLEMTQADRSSPELPHYDRVVDRGQPWRDLIGWYTRYGDVRELLDKVDDRYVIMNAGDELAMRFPPPPSPPDGWKRDYVWVSDGWVKDGNLNTRFGKTVLPLPAHDQTSYDRPPGRLEDDPVYRRFPRDWEIYHTRYVTPYLFERGLRNFRR